MMNDEASPPPTENRLFWRGLLIVMVVGLAAIRVLYLAKWCSLDLAPDEAHYWDWSRHLDWSYYSKGPLVAWLIRAAIELFGPLSIELTGYETMALRLPAVMCGSLLLVSLYVLSLQVFGSDRLAFFTAFFSATLPGIAACSILMTIDSPFLCLWGWALVAGHRAITRNERWAWFVTGLLVGFGILAKYTMCLWLFSLVCLCLFSLVRSWLSSLGRFPRLISVPEHRDLLFRSGFWLMVGTAFVCCFPILWWNFNNDWVTFRHVAGQAGVPNQGIRWQGPLEYVGMQLGLLIGYWFIAWVIAMIHFRPWVGQPASVRYLWWMSAPTFVVFGAFTLKSSGQVNWPVATYISGAVLMTAWLVKAVDSTSAPYRRLSRTGVALACALGIAVSIVSHNSQLVKPALEAAANQVKPNDPLAIRVVDPTTRLRGWKYLGKELDAVRRSVRDQDGIDPLVAASSWASAGELGFYCDNHPQVFSLGLYFGDRHSQYDRWRPNPVDDAQVFRGKTFVVVGDHEPTLRVLFTQVSRAREVDYREGAVRVALWNIWICSGYREIRLENPSPHY